MLELTYNGIENGEPLKGLNDNPEAPWTNPGQIVIAGSAHSAAPLDRVEVIVNGEIAQALKPANRPTPTGGYISSVAATVKVEGTCWIAVRCFESRPDKRIRFAHAAPIHVIVEGKPLRPRRVEIEYLVKRVQDEIERNKGVLTPEELSEFEKALSTYKDLLARSR
jgi:hypothetical protein